MFSLEAEINKSLSKKEIVQLLMTNHDMLETKRAKALLNKLSCKDKIPIVKAGLYHEIFCESKFTTLVYTVASCTTNLEILTKLKQNATYEMLEHLLTNPHCPTEWLYETANNPKQHKHRVAVARNGKCPADLLVQCSMCFNARYAVAIHPNSTIEAFNNILKGTPEPVLRTLVAENPNCPSEILVRLSKSTNKDVLLAVVKNTNTPMYIIEKLAK
jgi:hypothetical protein